MITPRQLATILAALRYWQREGLMSSGHEHDIASDNDTLEPLNREEIDALCESLNFGDHTDSPAHPFIAKIARLKLDGEYYDSEGNLVDPGEHSARVLEACERYTQEPDDAITCLADLIEEARGIVAKSSACNAPAGESNPTFTDLLPDDFPLRLGEDSLGDADVSVPYPLVEFARSMHGKPESIVIGLLYDNEAILNIDEQLPDDRDTLIAEGWPARFIDFLIEAADDGHNYIRLV